MDGWLNLKNGVSQFLSILEFDLGKKKERKSSFGPKHGQNCDIELFEPLKVILRMVLIVCDIFCLIVVCIFRNNGYMCRQAKRAPTHTAQCNAMPLKKKQCIGA